MPRSSDVPDIAPPIAIAELESRYAGQVAANHYGPPVTLLHPGTGDWFLRANIWPAAADSVMTASGPEPFLYGMAHDHNLSFLRRPFRSRLLERLLDLRP